MKNFLILILLSLCVSAYSGEREVKVINDKAKISLGGTLSIPDDVSPKAFIVLASGSGAQNRDEEILGHKPFKVISDALTSNGFGVLRMDDRGVGESEGFFENAVLDDLTEDIVSGVNFIRSQFPESKVGIMGHSQGSQIAIKAAARDDADFIVTLAGPAWPGDSLIMSQCRALAVATTGSWPGEQLERTLLDIAKSQLSNGVAMTLIVQEFIKTLGEMGKVPEVQKQVIERVQPLLSPMYRDMLRYDPSNDISHVKVPWIALNGDKDLQVLADNLRTIKELNPNAKTIVLEGHNHLFQHAATGLPDEYRSAGQSPSPETITAIVEALSEIDFTK